MGTERIIYEENGQLKIVIPVPGYPLDAIMEKVIPAGLTGEIVDVSDIPSDRTFRDAWKKGITTKIETDMPKARSIHMSRIRQVRDKVLKQSDVSITRAMEMGDTPTINRLRAERQKLRDIPQTFDLELIQTPEELKTAWPADLPLETL